MASTRRLEIIDKIQAVKESSQHSITNFQLLIDFSIVGAHIQIFADKDFCKQAHHFCQDYFKYFPVDASKKNLKIYYHLAPSPWNDPNHDDWNEQDPLFHYFNEGNITYMKCRDVAAQINFESGEVHAFGPYFHTGATDSIDNLLQFTMMTQISHLNTFLVHAAAIVHDNQAYLFFGESGAGKSTLAHYSYQKWQKPIISADSVYIKEVNQRFVAYPNFVSIYEFPQGSPARCYQTLPIAALIHLTRSSTPDLELAPVEYHHFLTHFLGQNLSSWDLDGHFALAKSLKLYEDNRIIKARLSYNKDYPLWDDLPQRLKDIQK